MNINSKIYNMIIGQEKIILISKKSIQRLFHSLRNIIMIKWDIIKT